jgi:hypothetical protein
MIISVTNHSHGKIRDEDMHRVIRAVNRQIAEDFVPYWGMGARLRLEGHTTEDPDKGNPVDLRGDAILYVWDRADVPNALGYHEHNNKGIPYGFVFLDVAERMGENWTVTFSHEALELIADPEVNLLVMGPHPADARKTVFYWYEMCDAVQGESYTIDGVDVSNFVLPPYFTGTEERERLKGRRDFLSRSYHGETLRSFGVNPGGYLGFYNPATGQHETYIAPTDKKAEQRVAAKAAAQAARRGVRYGRYHVEAETTSPVGQSLGLGDVVLRKLQGLLDKQPG